GVKQGFPACGPSAERNRLQPAEAENLLANYAWVFQRQLETIGSLLRLFGLLFRRECWWRRRWWIESCLNFRGPVGLESDRKAGATGGVNCLSVLCPEPNSWVPHPLWRSCV